MLEKLLMMFNTLGYAIKDIERQLTSVGVEYVYPSSVQEAVDGLKRARYNTAHKFKRTLEEGQYKEILAVAAERPELLPEEKELLKEHRKLEAIKSIRTRTGFQLREAKELAEHWMTQTGIPLVKPI